MNTDSIPLISQAKSLYHVIKGDKNKAKQIQSTFSKQCIVVSQIRSAVEAIGGNPKAAKRTQDEFTSAAPLISQIRSSIEIAIGKRNDAIKTQEKYINNLLGLKGENKIRLNIETRDGDGDEIEGERSPDKNLKTTYDKMEQCESKECDDNEIKTITRQGTMIEVPDEFLCSITWEIMEDPVICSDGNTYERKAIEDWLFTNDTSPKTNMPLDDNKLIPNRALKYLIHAWKIENKYDETQVIHTDHSIITEEIVILKNENENGIEEEQEMDENLDELIEDDDDNEHSIKEEDILRFEM
eukprot:CAMPEP_0201572148 /NCGR_PEP_ID=MMETSP0190_2-20130828/15261_1 /ASSEMBLY_ACC=CAM_ASM_000263 /TAXON_ID=37353 /ORGANISM="Rosalina sp." /LENGTH=297 /DNA_ID=CAMNT_0047997547 /DNA_START=29 /DNA_END=922 /DNA_ORIENTATION=-